jgi:hypothetical protein
MLGSDVDRRLLGVRSWLARRSDADRRLLVVFGLLALAAAVQHWYSVADGIRVQFAHDVSSYLVIAYAAPSLPTTPVLQPFAERIPVHWVVGVISNAGVSVGLVYRVGMIACLLGVVFAVHATLTLIDLRTGEYALAMAALAASAYPFHYLLASPGMLSDAMLVLGVAVLLLGFARRTFWIVLLGLALGTAGRQTMVPVALVAAVWAFVSPAWVHVRWRVAGACLALPVGIYIALNLAARGFGYPEPGGLHDLSVLGFLTGPQALVEHLGRVTLGVMVPAGLALGAWLRTRNPLPRGALLVAAAVAAQPLVLGPSSNGGNEPRLAGLAAPALVVAAGALLRGARLTRRETALAAVVIVVAGLHSRYTHSPLLRNYVWAGAEVVASLALVAVLGRRHRTGKRESPA